MREDERGNMCLEGLGGRQRGEDDREPREY